MQVGLHVAPITSKIYYLLETLPYKQDILYSILKKMQSF